MTIFQHKIPFNNFGEIYVGYRLEIISAKQILEFSEKEMIVKSNKSRTIELKEAYQRSLPCFVDKIISFCCEDDIFFNEKYIDNLFELPDKYFRIWELEFLLSVSEMNISKEEKLDKIYELFYFFSFPKEWALNNFIRYSLKEKNIMYTDIELIYNLNKYINKELVYFIEKQKNK